jgi:DNA-nicking Smr family endonuclease
MRRGLTDQDRADWAHFTRLIAPLPGRATPAAPTAVPAPPPTPRPAAPRPPPAARPQLGPVAIGLQPPGVDNATWQRFRTGKLPSTRTLDLHGRTAHRAFHVLHDFLRRSHADHVRVVEIITGRGSAEGSGVIRREFALWLNLPDLRPLVLAAAHPHAANEGAVRLLLRRPK